MVLFFRILLGVFFIFSGVIKLFPIQTFELTFVDLGIASWSTAPFFARFVISIELLLGIFLIINWKIKQTLIFCLGLLGFFSIYIAFLWISRGDDVNCGCLGDFYSMGPAESLIKNAVLLIISGGLLFFLKKETPFKDYLILSIVIATFGFPYILNPLPIAKNVNDENSFNEKIDLSLITPFSIEGEIIDLSKGKKYIAFVSATCEHCKNLAYKLQILTDKKNLTDTYLIFKGDPEQEKLDLFFKESNSTLPYSNLNDDYIFDLTGGKFPTVILIEDSYVKKAWSGSSLSNEELDRLVAYLK